MINGSNRRFEAELNPSALKELIGNFLIIRCRVGHNHRGNHFDVGVLECRVVFISRNSDAKLKYRRADRVTK